MLSDITPADAVMMSRDPFQPVSAVRCSQDNTTQRWRLKGVIGSGQAWIGWLVLPEQQWRRLTPGAVIPEENWQVRRLDKSGATLAAIEGADRCDGASAEVFLASPFINNAAAQ
ncbi:DUF2531 family protein [Brenneria izadpanahii]|uniref:DUF2531 family protein n=2 Tax=Brenneria izadpanahii TaxID=2722756 RepID=A0ABX7UXT7_9GAMM|nr:DUF2531 family protein [Brenneria izadpanahii]